MKRMMLAASAALLLAAPCVMGQAVDADGMAREVKQELLRVWEGYERYAWGHDELAPVSNAPRDWYPGVSFCMTPVDALDTLVLMGLTAQVDRARELIVERLSFDQNVYVSVFEFTIRLMGGLISGYQLTGDGRLLRLAVDLADRELPAFRSPTGMPYGDVNLRTGAVRRPVSNPAEIGTLLVEFGALSRITGNAAYYDAAKAALLRLCRARSPIGLVGSSIDVTTGAWTATESHISGGIDSYYEYLVKCARLFDDADCAALARESLAAVTTHLTDDGAGGLWYCRVDMDSGRRMSRRSGSLDAFFPAVLALSGDLGRAARFMDSCFAMWNRYGVEPETYDYVKRRAVSAEYLLRPEIVESAYYLYHYTGDESYRAMGKTIFDGLRRYCRTEAGYAELESVVTKRNRDRMESFFPAETMKYLYLLFAPRDTLDFNAVTFNTEAHPIHRTW